MTIKKKPKKVRKVFRGYGVEPCIESWIHGGFLNVSVFKRKLSNCGVKYKVTVEVEEP